MRVIRAMYHNNNVLLRTDLKLDESKTNKKYEKDLSFCNNKRNITNRNRIGFLHATPLLSLEFDCQVKYEFVYALIMHWNPKIGSVNAKNYKSCTLNFGIFFQKFTFDYDTMFLTYFCVFVTKKKYSSHRID